MKRYFNITGPCLPCEHYMVDLQNRLAVMKKMIDRGQYFTINRARQFGKTTILKALYQYLKKDYYVISLDFQALSHTDFENEQTFVSSFSELLIHELEFDEIPIEVKLKLKLYAENRNSGNLRILFHDLKVWCAKSEKPIVLLIDEVDSASNYQVFLDFLAQLRADYINRDKAKTF